MAVSTTHSTATTVSVPAGQAIRAFLAVEAATFVVAAMAHFGILVPGYGHGAAAVAESVIGLVLVTALAATWLRPASVPSIGLGAQAFAFLGTLVGVFTIAIGVGPRTVPDVLYHVAILGVLAWGIAVANRTRTKRKGPIS
jgi:hypothetical protein